MHGDNSDNDKPFSETPEDTLMGTLESLEHMIETGQAENIPVLNDFVTPGEAPPVPPQQPMEHPVDPSTSMEQQLDLYEDQINDAREEMRETLMERFQHEIDAFVEHDVHEVVTNTCNTVMESASSQFEALLRYQLESSLKQILRDLTTDIKEQAAADLPGTTPESGETDKYQA
jgi:hypothetical protein